MRDAGFPWKRLSSKAIRFFWMLGRNSLMSLALLLGCPTLVALAYILAPRSEGTMDYVFMMPFGVAVAFLCALVVIPVFVFVPMCVADAFHLFGGRGRWESFLIGAIPILVFCLAFGLSGIDGGNWGDWPADTAYELARFAVYFAVCVAIDKTAASLLRLAGRILSLPFGAWGRPFESGAQTGG